MVEQGYFAQVCRGGERTARIVWSPHEYKKSFRDVLGAQMVRQTNHTHTQTGQTANVHETTRKKSKQANLQVLKKRFKTKKRENKIKIVKKKKEKRTRAQKKTTQHAADTSRRLNARKKWKKTRENWVKRGTLCAEILQQQKMNN